MLAAEAARRGGRRDALEAACLDGREGAARAACTCSARSPSCSTWRTASAWSRWPTSKALVTQVGYHYRFVGAFKEAARIVAFGRARPRAPRSRRGLRAGRAAPEGQHLALGEERGRGRAVRLRLPRHRPRELHRRRARRRSAAWCSNSVFSRDVDDEVYCTLHYAERRERPAVRQLERRELSQDVDQDLGLGHATAASPPIARSASSTCASRTPACPASARGWTVRYTTDLTEEVWYYLRGEEYSAQIDYFVQERRSKDAPTARTPSARRSTPIAWWR